MHVSPKESRPARSRRSARIGYRSPQSHSVEARKAKQILKTPENWRDELLASGPDRGVHFEVELGSTTVVRAEVVTTSLGERPRGHIFYRSTTTPDDFADYGAWIDQLYPARGRGQ